MKFVVTWKEKRTIICSAEVEATSQEEAIRLAQDYEFEVEENEVCTDENMPGKAKQIEFEK